MKIRTFSLLSVCFYLALGSLAHAIDNQKPGSPLDDLPDYIRKVNEWGQRADFSHDGKKILFIEKTYGDAYELDLATGKTTPVTHHYYHGGYTRALYLSNGDILLSGTTSFDAENPHVNRREFAELWVQGKSLKEPPTRLGTFCAEGPAVSRTDMRIAWTTHPAQYPDSYRDGEFRVHVADIEYRDDEPYLANSRVVLSTIDNPFMVKNKPRGIETQNFIPGDESRITLSLYGYMGGSQVAILDLKTGDVEQISNVANHHNEPEGIYPDGHFTLMESSRQFGDVPFEAPVQYIDIWKLPLDGDESKAKRITFFSDFEGYKSSNPVVSDDGRYIAFQMAKLGDPAGVGRGLFILDLEARAKAINSK